MLRTRGTTLTANSTHHCRETDGVQKELISRLNDIKSQVDNILKFGATVVVDNHIESLEKCSTLQYDLNEALHNVTSTFQDDDLNKYRSQINQMRSQLSTLAISLSMATFSFFSAKAEHAENHLQILDFCEIASKYLFSGTDEYQMNNEKLYNMELHAIQTIKNNKTTITSDNKQKLKVFLVLFLDRDFQLMIKKQEHLCY